MRAIASMSSNHVIGRSGAIPWHIPEDLRWFREVTMGDTLVMGRCTFDGLMRPLDGRKIVVLTHRDLKTSWPDVTAAGTLPDFPGDVWLCGGAQVYAQYLWLCTDLFLTVVDRTVCGDAFFPCFSHMFKLVREIARFSEFRVIHYRALGDGQRNERKEYR